MNLKLAFLGDTAFIHDKDISKCNYKKYYEKIKKILQDCDHIIVNLESPLSNDLGHKVPKSANLFSRKENIEILKYIGVDIVNLANNHILDYGTKSLNDTLEVLNNNSIDYFGIYNKDIILNNKIRLIGMNCYSTNGVGYDDVVNTMTMENLKNVIQDDRYINIVSIHMGQEHVAIPNLAHVKLFRNLLSQMDTKNVIIGHHPHVLQGYEDINKSRVYYSLGNFIFDDIYVNGELLIKRTKKNKEGGLILLDIDNDDISYKQLVLEDNGYEINVLNNQETIKIFAEYNHYLGLNEDKMNTIRNNILNDYISQRKSMRNLKWYLKRLNLNYAKLFVTNYLNSCKFNRYIH